jgi:hypothetical protein
VDPNTAVPGDDIGFIESFKDFWWRWTTISTSCLILIP